MNKAVGPLELNFSIRICVMVFLMQLYILYSFMYDSIFPKISNYQPFTLRETCLRMIAALLYQKVMFSELYDFTKLLTYLKRMK